MPVKEFVATNYANASPLTPQSLEPACADAKVIVATRGYFTIEGKVTAAFISGPRSSPLHIVYSADVECNEWAISPLSLRTCFDVQLTDVTQSIIDLDGLPRCENVRRVLSGDALLPDRTREVATHTLSHAGWRLFKENPCQSVSMVADILGISVRRLEQVFSAEIGMSPKRLQRLFRYEKASDLLRRPDLPLASIAITSGYSDQSHMNREVNAFSGLSPKMLRGAFQLHSLS